MFWNIHKICVLISNRTAHTTLTLTNYSLKIFAPCSHQFEQKAAKIPAAPIFKFYGRTLGSLATLKSENYREYRAARAWS
jgi:hypothetical protein